MNKQYTQQELYEIMQKYDTMDRKVIKQNLNQMKDKTGLRNIDIANELEFKVNKVAGYFNMSNPVIPTFIDALKFCNTFSESIEEVIQIKEEETEKLYLFD